MLVKYAKHVILGNVDYTNCSTDNNCVSISIDFGKNSGDGFQDEVEDVTTEEEDMYVDYDRAVSAISSNDIPDTGTSRFSFLASKSKKKAMPTGNRAVINRARMILSERDTSQKQFTALKSRAPFYSVLKFETGAVIVVGLQDPALTNLCATKTVTDIADTLKYPIRIRNVSIVNTVSTFNRFHLNFTGIVEFFNRHCIAYVYNPETFPGMFFKLRVPARKLETGETLGEYYTRVAAMRDSKDPNYKVTDWLRVKTVLTFKVGKNTVLGECGNDDVSVISKLLFGLFHYFMDHSIKLSPNEARRIRARYGIPPLEWYLHVDMLFHSHPYVKPSRSDVLEAILIDGTTGLIDKTYYGTGNSSVAPLSANLLPPGVETSRVVDSLAFQKLCGPATLTRRCALVPASNKPRGWWRKKSRPDPFALARLGAMSEFPAGMMNGKLVKHRDAWWLDRDFKPETAALVNLCHDEFVKECEAVNLIPAAFMRNYVISESHGKLAHTIKKMMQPEVTNSIKHVYSAAGIGRVQKVVQAQRKHRVSLARLDTHMAAFKFISKHLASGLAPELSGLLGTDVYSLLHLVKGLPKSRGHALSVNTQALINSSSAFKTPGDAYFSSVLDDDVMDGEKCDNPTSGATALPSGTAMNRSASRESSQFKCEACRQSLAKGSASVSKGLCEACDQQSTYYIESALSDLRRDKKAIKRPVKEESDARDGDGGVGGGGRGSHCRRVRNKKLRVTPSDFIDSVFKFTDERTGTPKVGLEFNVKDILRTLVSNRGMEDRPTANYRTSLHTDTQNKSNLNKLLVAALKENGATENEAQIFEHILERGKGLSVLCELAKGKRS